MCEHGLSSEFSAIVWILFVLINLFFQSGDPLEDIDGTVGSRIGQIEGHLSSFEFDVLFRQCLYLRLQGRNRIEELLNVLFHDLVIFQDTVEERIDFGRRIAFEIDIMRTAKLFRLRPRSIRRATSAVFPRKAPAAISAETLAAAVVAGGARLACSARLAL